MKIFVDIGHPAHVHYFKNLILNLGWFFIPFAIFVIKKIALLKFFLEDHDLYQIVTYNIHHPHSQS